jgi:alpha-L-fucosidase
MFIHWGLYSIPGGVWNGKQIHGYSEQIQAHARIPREEYVELATQFNPTHWDPESVAQLAVAAGMKFIVLTSKHHDGFSLFKTEQSGFNVVDATPYGLDIVAGLADACKRHGLSFGVYFSTIDWHFEGATGIDYGEGGVRNDNEIPSAHADFNAAQLKELMTGYGPISEVWFDMGSPTPEQSARFADTVHSLQPDTMVSGRVFNYEGDFTVMGDNEIPPYLLEEPWQSPASIFHETWGFRSWQERKDLGAKVKEHLENFVRVVSRGGNYLLNIGPRGDGSIVEFEADVLQQMGDWMRVNHEALENCEPQPFRSLDFGSCTLENQNLYLFVTEWPEDGRLALPGLRNQIIRAEVLGSGLTLKVVSGTGGGAFVDVSGASAKDHIPVVKVILDGPPIVQAPGLSSDESGKVTLTISAADIYYRTNGRGYYDPPMPYQFRWQVDFASARRLSVEVQGDDPDSTNEWELLIGDMKVDLEPTAPGEPKHVELPEDLALNAVQSVTLRLPRRMPR